MFPTCAALRQPLCYLTVPDAITKSHPRRGVTAGVTGRYSAAGRRGSTLSRGLTGSFSVSLLVARETGAIKCDSD